MKEFQRIKVRAGWCVVSAQLILARGRSPFAVAHQWRQVCL